MNTSVHLLKEPFAVGDWLVDPRNNELTQNGQAFELEARAMEVLCCLAAEAGQTLSQDDIMQRVWGETVVGGESITRCISLLRKTFGDDVRNPKYIRTIRNAGYRLIAPVELTSHASAVHDVSYETDVEEDFETPEEAASARNRILIAAFAGLSLALLIWVGVSFVLEERFPVGWTQHVVASTGFNEEFGGLSPDGSRIAFNRATNDGLGHDIYVVIAGEAAQAVRLTEMPGHQMGPSWSPDGKFLAFYSGHDGKTALYTIPATGGVPRQIHQTHAFISQAPGWSADGVWLAFTDKEEANQSNSLYRVEVLTGKVERLTQPDHQHWGDYNPKYSPDGRKLTFIRSLSAGTHALFSADLSDEGAPREVRQLSKGIRRVMGHGWSPNGDAIILSSYDDIGGRLYVMNPSGSALRPLGLPGFAPEFGRDGTSIVAQKHTANEDIVLVNVSTGEVKTSSSWNSQYRDFAPDWSPDGRRISFISERSGHPELWLAGIDGGEPFQMTNFKGPYVNSTKWSPDGGTILITVFTEEGNGDIYAVDVESRRVSSIENGAASQGYPSYTGSDRDYMYSTNDGGHWEIRSEGKPPSAPGFEGYRPVGKTFTRFEQKGVWEKKPDSSDGYRQIIKNLRLLDAHHYDIAGDYIYWVDRETAMGPNALKKKNLKTGETTDIGPAGWVGWTPGLAVSPDGEWILLTQIANFDSDILFFERK